MWSTASLKLFSFAYIPHGHCYLWQTPLVSLHAISDLLIAIAYFCIAIALIYFVSKKQHSLPAQLVFLFGLFISLCGLGHLFDIVTLWHPAYWMSGGIRAATACVSAYTAIEMIILLPRFLALQEVEAANKRLEAEVSKRSAHEQALERSQKIFRSAFYDIPIGMALVSLEGYFIEVNEAVSKIVGYSSEELKSIDFQSITHPDDLQSDMKLVENLLAGNLRCYKLEKRYIHRLGHTVPIELTVSLLRDEENNPLLFIAHVQDISERNRINTSLKAATEEARAANQAKGDFLAMMSHEIRTPMNAMLGMAELIEETSLDQEQQSCVKAIRTSGKTLLTVINDILDFSKIESNKLELEISRINIHNTVEDVVTLFSNQAKEKGLSLSSSIEPPLIPTAFKGDAVRLKQVLNNLVSNSIKFTDTGNVSIDVRARCLKESLNDVSNEAPENTSKEATPQDDASLSNRYRIHFLVSDTGIGISQEKIGKLFEPFSQVDSSITRRFGSTGLGLSISRRLVEMMGGQLLVDSKPGHGSTFRFSIELEACRTLVAKEQNITDVNPTLDITDKELSDRTPLHTPLRILLTEDIALNRTVALKMLDSYGYQADVACDGTEAIAAVQKQPYDLILMDVQMPKMCGLEATQKIRLNQHSHQPHIVAMTAHAMQGDREECLSVGMDDYIQKPIRKQDILDVLQRCMQLKCAKSESRDPLKMSDTFKERAVSALEERQSTSKYEDSENPTGAIEVDQSISTLDKETLESFGTERDFLIEVCESFLADAPGRIQSLETALQQKNTPTIANTAHALKSLCSCVGAMNLSQMCQAIEAAVREEVELAADTIAKQVKAEYAQVQTAIQNYKRTH